MPSNEAELFPVFVLGAVSSTLPWKWRTLILLLAWGILTKAFLLTYFNENYSKAG